MTRWAALEPIIAILVAVGWFIVKALVDRRQNTDEWEEMEQLPPQRPRQQPAPSPPPRPEKTRPPLPPPFLRPQAGPPQPPSLVRKVEPIRPVIIEDEGPVHREFAHLKQSHDAYARAAQLQQAVADRLSAIDHRTTSSKPAIVKKRARPAAAAHILKTFRNPDTVRQAFLAQFVLNPPKALE